MLAVDTQMLERLMQATPTPPDYGRGPRGAMLVVEDDPRQAEQIARKLASAGQVHTASNADMALQKLDQNPAIAVLVTDLRTPGEHDGEWLIDRVRERHPHVRIIGISAFYPNLTRIRAKTAACFEKPFRLRELAMTVSMLAMEAGLP